MDLLTMRDLLTMLVGELMDLLTMKDLLTMLVGAVISAVVSAAFSTVVSWVFYWLASRDLREATKGLRVQIGILKRTIRVVVDMLVEKGFFEGVVVVRDQDGNPTSFIAERRGTDTGKLTGEVASVEAHPAGGADAGKFAEGQPVIEMIPATEPPPPPDGG